MLMAAAADCSILGKDMLDERSAISPQEGTKSAYDLFRGSFESFGTDAVYGEQWWQES